MATAYTSAAAVLAALGTGAAPAPDDVWLLACVDAANAATFRKRTAAGYPDDPDATEAPDGACMTGATLWAVALWRERQSTDSFQSFEDLSTFTPTGGTWGTIKRLLGIGRAQVDALPVDVDAAAYVAARRRRRRRRMGIW